MNTYNVAEIKDFSFFNKDVCIDKKFLLLIPECPFTAEVKTMLEDWDFELVYSEGEPASFKSHGSEAENTEEGRKAKKTEMKIPSKPTKEEAAALEKLKKYDAEIEEVEKKLAEFSRFVENIFTGYSVKKAIDNLTVTETVKEICEFVRKHKKVILRIETKKYGDTKNYLTAHSLRSTVLAIIIGMQLKMSQHRLIELGTATLLHEIGMIRLPPQYYMYSTSLSEEGRKAILAHPVLSYNILKESSFSMPICLGVLEHHERENGKGYPRNLPKEKISIYGKIIAVACSYEAATGIRPYKETSDASSILFDMLKNTDNQYDDTILKALLFSLSFYPVGIYVHLSNGKIAQVIDINPDDPRYPIVKIYEKSPMSTTQILRTEKDGLHIKRPLNKEEIQKLNQSTAV